ncbi:hypothetical protein [Methylorubrum thiocyanatum]|uniref:hypothetical protein n=1 Tax=Methylorubrum thiocyanatum TaxID=47958 RepID=UPI003F7EEFF9
MSATESSIAGELLQQLKAQVAALDYMIEALEIDPERTHFTASAVGPDGSRRPLAAVAYAELRRNAVAAIAAAEADKIPAPRKRGPLSAADAEALRLDLGAGTLLILTRDRASRAAAALSAAGADTALLEHDEAHALWRVVGNTLSTFPDEQEPTT